MDRLRRGRQTYLRQFQLTLFHTKGPWTGHLHGGANFHRQRLRYHSANSEQKLRFYFSFWGAVPGPVLVGPPGQQSSSGVDVCTCVRSHALLCLFLSAQIRCPSLWLVLGECQYSEDWLGARTFLLGYSSCARNSVSSCTTGGGSCGAGVLVPLGTTVPWGVPQKCRAAHGPRHLAMTTPLRPCWVCLWLSVRYFRDRCWFFCVVFLSLGSE